MTYHKNIINRVKESDNWPGPERADFLDELNEVADDAFGKNTIEGYLAALLIYHQLTEELLKIIIDCSVFYIQLRVFPQEYQKKDLKGKMFGQIIQELKHSVLDEKTTKLIDQSLKLNALRIKMVHKLTLKSSLGDIKRQCKQAKKLFDSIFELYDDIYDNYRVTFKDFKKYPEELEELIE
tara:strand:+ start:1046 stop:1588 length:543 start_codon:yes stop_codon:yes gene_type:complete